MKKIIDFFKNIFGQKVSKAEPGHNTKDNVRIEKKIISSVKMKGKTMLFKKQQLPGKILTLGESHFRIKQKIGETADRLKYQIEQL